jgi:magnesium transporter
MNPTHWRLCEAFGKTHPSELASIVERGESNELAAVLDHLSDDVAATVMKQCSAVALARALPSISPKRQRAILARLDVHVLAALLARVDSASRQNVLNRLPEKLREGVLRVSSYSDDQVGSRMDPTAPAVARDATVENALATVGDASDGALYYVYVTHPEQHLAGVVSLRELMSADPTALVGAVMVSNAQYVLATEGIEAVVRHRGWRRFHALPVVDRHHNYLGAVRYSTFRQLEAEAGQALAEADPNRTAGALAELFWLSAAAIVGTAEAALLGGRSNEESK